MHIAALFPRRFMRARPRGVGAAVARADERRLAPNPYAMRRWLCSFVCLAGVASAELSAQRLVGQWQGYWHRAGDSMAVTLHVERDSATRGFTARFDSDRLRVAGIPFTSVAVEGCCDVIMRLVGDRTTAVFRGVVRGDVFGGELREGESVGRFAYTRARSAAAPVIEREVTFRNGDVTLAGSLLLPPGAGAHPAVVFVHGSGAEGRWASRFLGTTVAKHGVAALIFDKRGVGKSTGDWRTASIDDLAADDAAAVAPKPRLAALDTATGVWRPLAGTPGPYGDGFAKFSSDGAWIYLANAPINRLFSTFGSAVFRVRADGAGAAEPVGYDRDGTRAFDHPSPSPDGSRVAMTVFGSSGMYTLIVPASPPLGAAPPEYGLVGTLATGGHPSWSPVSDDLLMFGTEGMWLMRAGATSVAERRYLALDRSSAAHVTGGYQGASWSPDGRWIVAKSSTRLILVEVATDRVLPLPFGDRLAEPAWRPR